MSPHNVYAATIFPKEEPFILRILNVMAVWLFSVAHTPARPHSLDVEAVPSACPGSFF
jgi:hypothetical protein